jgi:hypothetical protein
MNMSTEDNSLPAGGEASPAATPAPKSDAEAALQQQAAAPPVDEAAKAATRPKPTRKPPRKASARKTAPATTSTASTAKTVNCASGRSLTHAARRNPSRAKQQQQQPQADTGPTLQDFNYDLTAFQHARDQWVIEQAEKRWTASQKQQASTAREQETWATYESKAAEFADDHPDFEEVVGSIAYPLTEAAQAAIATLPNGPEIAYHLGNNDDDAYDLARTPPHLADAAVRRLAARLGAAPPPVIPAAQAPVPKPKPISQAPAPVPTVSGAQCHRSPG